MTTFDRHLTLRFLSAAAKTTVALLLIFVVIDFLTVRQDQVIRYGVPLAVVAEYYLTTAPTILFQYQVAAIAVLVAGLMVLGRAAELNEVTALLAGGVSLWRVVRGPLLAAMLLALGAFALEETAGARLAARAAAIDEEYLSAFSSNHRPGVSWANLEDGWSCHIIKYNREAHTGEDVYLHRIGPDAVQEIRADRIHWDAARGQWLLEDGRWVRFATDADWAQRVTRITQAPAPIVESPAALFALEAPPESKSARGLRTDLEGAEARGVPTRGQWVDYHAKFARPVLIFVMMLLAVPFAMRVRRGGFAVGLGLSIGIALAYLLCFYIGMGLGQLGRLDPLPAAWLANAVFFAGALVLCRRTPT
jgi:lipopolysaccharide export system permease protein